MIPCTDTGLQNASCMPWLYYCDRVEADAESLQAMMQQATMQQATMNQVTMQQAGMNRLIMQSLCGLPNCISVDVRTPPIYPVFLQYHSFMVFEAAYFGLCSARLTPELISQHLSSALPTHQSLMSACMVLCKKRQAQQELCTCRKLWFHQLPKA